MQDIDAIRLRLQSTPTLDLPQAVSIEERIKALRERLTTSKDTVARTDPTVLDPAILAASRYNLDGTRTESDTKLLPGMASKAVAEGFRAGVMRGILYPVGSLIPRLYRRYDAEAQTSAATIAKFNRDSGLANEAAEAVMANAPQVIGDIAGSLVPGIPTYMLARNALRVQKAVEKGKFLEYAGKVTAAGVAQGSMQSVLAELDPGESRFARIARDTAMAGTFEVLGLPLLRKAWKSELSAKVARDVADALAAAKGTDIATAEELLDRMRQGITTDPVAAEVVAKAVPDTPIGNQAQKVLEAWRQTLVGRKPPEHNPILAMQDPNYGISFDVYNGDQFLQKVHIPSKHGDQAVTIFEKGVRDFMAQMEKFSTQGIPLRFDNFQFQSPGTWTRFTNLIGDRTPRKAPPPGDPIDSMAMTGSVPSAGTVVTTTDGVQGTVISTSWTGGTGDIAESSTRPGIFGGPPGPLLAPVDSGGSGGRDIVAEVKRRQAAVTRERPLLDKFGNPIGRRTVDPNTKPTAEDVLYAKVGEATRLPEPRSPQGILRWARGIMVRLRMASGNEVEVPLGKLKTLGMVGAEGERKPVTRKLNPHPDGTTRLGVIDMRSGEIMAEGIGVHGPWYRSDEFTRLDEGYDRVLVRVFADKDGVSLSVPVLGDATRVTPAYGHQVDVGLGDTIAARQRRTGWQGIRDPETVWEESGLRAAPMTAEQAVALAERKAATAATRYAVKGNEATVYVQTPVPAGAKSEVLTPGVPAAKQPQARFFRSAEKDAGGQYARETFAAREGGDIRRSRPWAGPMKERDPNAPYRSSGYDEYSGTATGLGRIEPEFDVLGSGGKGSRARSASRKTRGKTPSDTPTVLEHVASPNSALTRDMLSSPELVTARNAARILLRKGIDPETPVRMQLARQSHKWNVWRQAEGKKRQPWNPPYEMSLKELAELEPHIPEIGVMQRMAARRGLRIIPEGKGAVVYSTDGSYERQFSNMAEAYEAVGRLPDTDGRFSPKIEAELERAWNMGFDRGFDAEVDASKFRDVSLLMSNIHDVMGGKRPLVTVYSRHEDNFTAVTRAVQDFYRERQGMPATRKIRIVNLDNPNVRPADYSKAAATRSDKRMTMVVYDEDMVNAVFTKYARLFDHLGIRANDPSQVKVRMLAQYPHGLSMLMGRDPVDAFLYASLRARGQKDLWQKGRVQYDNLGAYRTFDPQTRVALGQAEMALPRRTPALTGKPCGV